jgi:hypothetical protein
MKKMMLGALLFIGGLLGVLEVLDLAVSNPGNWNGIGGIQGSLLCNGLTLPFVLFCILAAVGLGVCIVDTYASKNRSEGKK